MSLENHQQEIYKRARNRVRDIVDLEVANRMRVLEEHYEKRAAEDLELIIEVNSRRDLYSIFCWFLTGIVVGYTLKAVYDNSSVLF